ncbi:MAG: Motility protein [Pseudomonadota bacterium]|jgi:chemotaxis protein MotB
MAEAAVAEEEKPADAPAAAPEAAAAPATDAPAEGAAPAEEPVRPIIKKIILEDGHGGAHGGAWKIALADMMTAMMAFFLLMWLLGASNEDQRKSVADYFRPSSQSQIKFGELAGSNGLLGGRSVIDPDGFPFTAKQTALLERLIPESEGGTQEGESGQDGKGQAAGQGESGKAKQDRENFEKLEKELKEKLSENKQLKSMQDQVNITREKDGLRIEIIDKADYSMFKLGTNQLDPKAAQLLSEVAKSIKDLPNKVTIRGHTDSLGFAPDSGRNNWTLSTERADATRQLMQGAGLGYQRFQRIEGVADTAPFIPANPADPRNRRVSITVLNQ